MSTPSGSQQVHPPAVANQLKRRLEDGADAKRQRPPLPPPYILSSLVPESAMFEDLIRMEQKLDWTMLRKKAEVNDGLGKPVRTKRTLRVFVSNTAYNQTWQTATTSEPTQSSMTEQLTEGTTSDQTKPEGEGDVKPTINADTGEGVPGWTLRIEGRLLDTGNNRIDRTTKKRFSNCVKSLIVDMDNREPQNFSESNIVEWHAKQQAPNHSLDGFEIRRRGDQPIRIRITMHLDQYPDRFKVLPPLCDIIGVKEESRAGIMSAVWKFVKTVGAQDKDDVTKLRMIGGLEKLVDRDTQKIAFAQLPDLINRYLTHPDPITIHYQIRLDKDRHVHPQCFDIPIEIEDALKSKMHAVVQAFDGPAMKEVMDAEDEVAKLAQDIRSARQKRDFLQAFANDPANFINRWLSTQARDLDLILGSQIGAIGTNGGAVREEDLRRSDLFRLPWVEEAITIHEGARLAEKAEYERQKVRAQAQHRGSQQPQGR